MSDEHNGHPRAVKLEIVIERLKSADGAAMATPSEFRISVSPIGIPGKRLQLFNNGMPIEVAAAECVREVVRNLSAGGDLG